MDTERALAVTHLTFLRAREKYALYRATPSLDALLRLSRDDISDIIGRRLRTHTWDPGALGKRTRRDLPFLERRGVRLVAFGEPGYPPWLAEIYDPPFLLFVVGAELPVSRSMLAVVGTRTPSREGRTAARVLGRQAAEAGIPLVSGLARGIDTEAHRGAVEGRGATIAVLGCGIDTVYPAGNRGLAEQIIARGGAIVSEYPPGTPPRQFNFPERNRIISGLSRAVVVVEAPEHSGALITADYALEQGRDLMIHGISESSPRGAGARALADDGAEMISGLGEITAAWGLPAQDAVGGGGDGAGPARPGGPIPPGSSARGGAGGGSGTVGMQLALDLEAELTGGGNG